MRFGGGPMSGGVMNFGPGPMHGQGGKWTNLSLRTDPTQPLRARRPTAASLGHRRLRHPARWH